MNDRNIIVDNISLSLLQMYSLYGEGYNAAMLFDSSVREFNESIQYYCHEVSFLSNPILIFIMKQLMAFREYFS